MIIQQGLQKLVEMAHLELTRWSSYDPGQPGDLHPGRDNGIGKASAVPRRSGSSSTASQLAMAKSAGAKWILDSVYPVTVTPPVIGQVDSYAQDALMGKITADYFVSDSGW